MCRGRRQRKLKKLLSIWVENVELRLLFCHAEALRHVSILNGAFVVFSIEMKKRLPLCVPNSDTICPNCQTSSPIFTGCRSFTGCHFYFTFLHVPTRRDCWKVMDSTKSKSEIRKIAHGCRASDWMKNQICPNAWMRWISIRPYRVLCCPHKSKNNRISLMLSRIENILLNCENSEFILILQELSLKFGDEKSLRDHLQLPIQRINDYQLLLKVRLYSNYSISFMTNRW